jgi:hypothetical protein
MSYHSWQTKGPSKEYDAGMARMFGEKEDRHCVSCGLLPSWCECGTLKKVEAEIAAREADPTRAERSREKTLKHFKSRAHLPHNQTPEFANLLKLLEAKR